MWQLYLHATARLKLFRMHKVYMLFLPTPGWYRAGDTNLKKTATAWIACSAPNICGQHKFVDMRALTQDATQVSSRPSISLFVKGVTMQHKTQHLHTAKDTVVVNGL